MFTKKLSQNDNIELVEICIDTLINNIKKDGTEEQKARLQVHEHSIFDLVELKEPIKSIKVLLFILYGNGVYVKYEELFKRPLPLGLKKLLTFGEDDGEDQYIYRDGKLIPQEQPWQPRASKERSKL